MPDSKLDLSDIPESTGAELRRARRVGRPASGNAKQLIAIRIAPQLLRQLRRMAANNPNPAKPSSTNSSRNPLAESPSSPAPISSRVV